MLHFRMTASTRCYACGVRCPTPPHVTCDPCLVRLRQKAIAREAREHALHAQHRAMIEAKRAQTRREVTIQSVTFIVMNS